MQNVERDTLEKSMRIRQAECILDQFFHDRVTYPDNDFNKRKGICKALAEEFHPLVRLAQSCWGVRGLRLLLPSNYGPDAIITFWWRQAATVQITCAHQDYNRAMEREYLLAKGSGLLYKQWKRDKLTGHVVPEGKPIFEPSADLQERVERILKAINAKEENFHTGTEILLIQEDPASIEYLQEGHLHEQVCSAILESGSHYRQIYVNYGDNLRRVKRPNTGSSGRAACI